MHLVSHSPASDSQPIIKNGGCALWQGCRFRNEQCLTRPNLTQPWLHLRFFKEGCVLDNQLVDKETVWHSTGLSRVTHVALWVKIGSYWFFTLVLHINVIQPLTCKISLTSVLYKKQNFPWILIPILHMYHRAQYSAAVPFSDQIAFLLQF